MLAVAAVLASAGANTAAGNPLHGNPIDTLPKIEAPRPAAPSFKLEQPTQERALQALLSRKITPARFGIEGVHSIPFEQVAALFAPLAGHEVTIGDLVARANQVTQMYQKAGYVLSFGFIPAQDFTNGFVHVTVVEGYVKRTRIIGTPGPAEGELQRAAAHIEAERPLKRATLERYLNVLTLMPGMKVHADLQPPTQTNGATELTLDVKRQPVTFGTSVGYNNPGIRGLFTLTTNSLTPLGEQLQFTAIAPKGHNQEEYYSGVYTQPLGSDGLLGKIDASHYRGQPEDYTLSAVGLTRHIDNKRLGLTFAYPFLLNNQRSLTGNAGIYGVDNRDRFESGTSSASATSVVHVRVAQVQLAYSEVMPEQSRSASVGVFKGMNALGASQQSNSPVLGPYDLGFTRYTVNAAQSFALPYQFGVAAAAAAQYSHNTVPTPEQATFGGVRFGLGYPAGEVAGDSGWGALLELNRLFRTEYAYLKTVQPYVLADAARVYLNQGTLVHSKLASLALGMRISDQKHYTFDMSIAKPVDEKPANADNRPLRFNANYSYQFD